MGKKLEKEYIDYGEWNIPTSWDDITLKMYQDIERYYDGKDSGFDAREVLNIITGKSIDEINALPAEFLEIIMNKLSFLQTQPEVGEASNKVVINGDTYIINVAEKLRTGEYVQADTIIKSDKHNYAAILGILCRKEGEKYDSKFEAEVLNSRIEMFEKTPMVKLMPIVSFFFRVMYDIHNSYPIVFESKGGGKPHSAAYREFAQKWGNFKTLYEIADEKIEKIGEIYQLYLSDYLQFLSYIIDKGNAERAEDEFQENLRKAKRGRR